MGCCKGAVLRNEATISQPCRAGPKEGRDEIKYSARKNRQSKLAALPLPEQPRPIGVCSLSIKEEYMSLSEMNPPRKSDWSRIDVRLKISALWMVVMFVFIYADYYKQFMPGVMSDMMAGKKEGVQITQLSLLGFSILTIIPALMIFLSLAIPPKANRWVNIVVGLVFAAIGVLSVIGITWPFWVFYCILLICLPLLVAIYSWKWPKADLNDLREATRRS
jgi:hypothetical protein